MRVWEEDELENVVGNASWVLNSLSEELTVFESVERDEHESPPWYDFGEELCSVVLTDAVTSIARFDFENCKILQSVTIPDSVTSIGDGAFFFCEELATVSIHRGVSFIGENVFRECLRLRSFKLAEDSPYFAMEDGTIFSKDRTVLVLALFPPVHFTIPNTVTSISNHAFDGSRTWQLSVTIPDSVMSIGDGAFFGCCSLESVTIPDSVTSIGDEAFSESGLKTLVLPNSVVHIGKSAFSSLSIDSAVLPNKITAIEEQTFYLCKLLASIDIPETVVSIGNSAFGCCYSLCAIEFPRSLRSIGDFAFLLSGLTSVVIPETVESIGLNPFAECEELVSIEVVEGNHNYASVDGVLFDSEISLLISYPIGKDGEEYAIPCSVRRIGSQAFSCSKLKTVCIPEGVIAVDTSSFSYSCLVSVMIPRSIEEIAEDAFEQCDNLESVSVPKSFANAELIFPDCGGITAYE